jgi:hypothetical protein
MSKHVPPPSMPGAGGPGGPEGMSSSENDESWANVDYFHNTDDGGGGSGSGTGTSGGDKVGDVHVHVAQSQPRPLDEDATNHHMMVVLEEGSLRVAFSLQEDDI